MPPSATFPKPKRKRGNPLWGLPMLISHSPALATEFEQLVGQLHLTKEMYTSSRRLYVWCRHNKNRVYVPEWLLDEWKLTVDTTFNTAA